MILYVMIFLLKLHFSRLMLSEETLIREFFLDGWVLRHTSIVNVTWRRPAFSGGERPQMSLSASIKV